jgi:V8-like Glu-specific endopeptidase
MTVDKTQESYVSAPLYADELQARLQPRPALKSLADVPLDFSILISANVAPEIHTSLLKVLQTHEDNLYEAIFSLRGATIGRHALRPSIEIQQFMPESDIRQRQAQRVGFDGFLPDHLPLRLFPERLSSALKIPRQRQTRQLPDRRTDIHQATTIFQPDDRYTFNDTAFPWCTVGRVETANGNASGVMVGPRHLLTCNHAIQWNADNTAGWVKFTPAYFDGSAPFGNAWGTRVYWEDVKVVGPSVDRNEGQHDYVAVVLDRRIGDLTGWMGARSWSDDWDGESYWRHIGYPGDLGGQRPSYQRDISLDGSFWDREVHTRIFHQGDVWPGQSGGPFFAWWDSESWPRVVAVQSGQNSDENSASGGAHMVDCIVKARNEFP